MRRWLGSSTRSMASRRRPLIAARVFNSLPGRWFDRRSVLLISSCWLPRCCDSFHLGRSSLWYDEVVTMRLARTESPAALFQLLGQIDATRAPLHPLILQGWVAVLGSSDYAASRLQWPLRHHHRRPGLLGRLPGV